MDESWARVVPRGHHRLGGAQAGGCGPSACGDPCRPPSPARGRGVVPPQAPPRGVRTGGTNSAPGRWRLGGSEGRRDLLVRGGMTRFR